MHVNAATAWSALYSRLSALQDFQTAMLYSLNAIQAMATKLQSYPAIGDYWAQLRAWMA